MGSEKPPRHPKTAETPLTGEPVEAEIIRQTDAEAMPERSIDAAEASLAAEADAEIPREPESEPLTEDESARATDAAKAAEQANAFQSDAPRPLPQEVRPRQAQTSALVAAGIVGGLVALACAGAMQYAGFLPGGAAQKDNTADVAAFAADIDGLKQSVASLAVAPKSDDALQGRVAALEAAAKNAPPPAPAGDTATAGAASNAATDQQIIELRGQVDALKAAIAQAQQSQTVASADIGKRLEDAEKRLGAPSQEAAVARAIAAAGLKAAIDRGGPFRPELDTFAQISPDDPAVGDLKNFADTGIPSRADLIRRVPQVAADIVEATATPQADESWTERLMSGAKSLVKVRPVGNVEGTSVEAIAARFEDKVKNGDLPGAVTEWNSLPEAARSTSAAFKQSLDARIRVEDLVGDALSKAIADTGKQS